MRKMTKEEIEAKVNGIIASQLGVPDRAVKPEARLGVDMNADSLDAVEILTELENEFQVFISQEKFEAMEGCKVSEVYDLIGELINE